MARGLADPSTDPLRLGRGAMRPSLGASIGLLLAACSAAPSAAAWERRLAPLPGDGTVVRGIGFLHRDGEQFVLDLESLEGAPTERRRLDVRGDEAEVTSALRQLLRRHPNGVRVVFDGVHVFAASWATADPNQLLTAAQRTQFLRRAPWRDEFTVLRCVPVGESK